MRSRNLKSGILIYLVPTPHDPDQKSHTEKMSVRRAWALINTIPSKVLETCPPANTSLSVDGDFRIVWKVGPETVKLILPDQTSGGYIYWENSRTFGTENPTPENLTYRLAMMGERID